MYTKVSFSNRCDIEEKINGWNELEAIFQMNIDAKMAMPDLQWYPRNLFCMFLFAVSRRKWLSNLKVQMEKPEMYLSQTN